MLFIFNGMLGNHLGVVGTGGAGCQETSALMHTDAIFTDKLHSYTSTLQGEDYNMPLSQRTFRHVIALNLISASRLQRRLSTQMSIYSCVLVR